MPPAPGCPGTGLAYPEVTRAICLVPSASFSQAPWYALPVHLCRFRVRSVRGGYFLEVPGCFFNPIRRNNFRPSSHTRRLGSINPIPIDYGFRPRLRGRLTLRGLALRRNPWAFGGGVSHPSLATHASILTRPRSTTVHTAASQLDRRSPTTHPCG